MQDASTYFVCLRVGIRPDGGVVNINTPVRNQALDHLWHESVLALQGVSMLRTCVWPFWAATNEATNDR